jgi:hypothetical protein
MEIIMLVWGSRHSFGGGVSYRLPNLYRIREFRRENPLFTCRLLKKDLHGEVEELDYNSFFLGEDADSMYEWFNDLPYTGPLAVNTEDGGVYYSKWITPGITETYGDLGDCRVQVIIETRL